MLHNKNMTEDGSQELVYPKHASDANLSQKVPAQFEGLVATLAMVGFTREVRLVQSLHRLEVCQISLATAKMLNSEEEAIVDVDEIGILKVKLSEAKLAPCLITLEENIKRLTSFIGSLPSGDLESLEFSKYKFLEMIGTLGEFLVQERNKARANDDRVDVSESMFSCMVGGRA